MQVTSLHKACLPAHRGWPTHTPSSPRLPSHPSNRNLQENEFPIALRYHAVAKARAGISMHKAPLVIGAQGSFFVSLWFPLANANANANAMLTHSEEVWERDVIPVL